MRRFQDWRLSTRMIALVLASTTVPVSVAMGVAYFRGRALLARDAANLLAAHADQVAGELDVFNTGWATLGEVLARAPSVQAVVSAPHAAAADQASGFFRTLVARDARLAVVSAMALDGTVVASSEPNALGKVASLRADQRGAAAGQPATAMVLTPPSVPQGPPFVVYATPVRDEGGVVRGVVSISVRIEALWAIVRAMNDRAWTGSFVLVTDEAGVRLAHGARPDLVFHPIRPLTPEERAPMLDEQRFGNRTANLLEAVVSGPTEEDVGRLKRAARANLVELAPSEADSAARYGAARRTASAPWSVLAVVPAEAVEAPVRELVLSVLLPAALAALLGLLLATTLARAALSPLGGLLKASAALGRGELPAPLVVDRDDELGHFVARFNEMTAAVGQRREQLETRVQLRTTELSQANGELRAQKAELQTQAQALAAQGRELQERGREIERAGQLKSAFLANMSHELRTPLNSIIGFTELLHDDLGPTLDARHRKYLEDVRTSGRHLLGLINDILDLSKIEAGHLELELQAVAPGRAIEEAVGLVRSAAVKQGLRVEVEQHLARAVRADPLKLRQVLLNLLSNALKFTPPGGAVHVGCEDAGEVVRFWVRDEGPGIDAALLPRLFEPFVQGEEPMIKRHQGTGLGLAISRRLVLRHGGEIRVVNEPGARGARFEFTLPADAGAEALPLRLGDARPVVLLLEPDAERERVLRERLTDAGYAVASLLEGETAVAAAQRVHPEVIVLSPGEGQSGGLHALGALRHDAAARSVPLVLTTTPHAVGVLAKPLEPDEVLEVVGRALRPTPSTPATVLVVDDDEQTCALLVGILEPRGYRVETVASGAAALEAVKRRVPDVILTDLLMPEVSGFELVELLAGNPATHDVPVIVLTAMDLTPAQRARLASHVFATARKGDLSSAEVLAAVARAVGRARRLAVPVGPTVLVVDDHDLNRELARAILERRGYRVVEAEGGAEGVELARRERPALVLLDLAMPVMDGYATLSALRAAPETRDIPVMALTALAMRGDEQRARAAGFDDYVTKPIEQEVLVAAVRRLLEAGRAKA